jgi:hypothetical protein
MSVLTSPIWNSPADKTATMPFPDTMEECDMRARLRALRDTILVLAVQLVFRAMIILRRWNY